MEAQTYLAFRLGDSTLIIAQQNTKWCGHGPSCEEDIALANTSLDLIGHTQMWLGLVAKLKGQRVTADDLAYFRDAVDYRNILLVEYPNGDYAQTLMRRYLFDIWYLDRIKTLCASSYNPIQEIAQKCLNEVSYHREYSQNLVQKLGRGTLESYRRLQNALDKLWPYFGEALEDSPLDIKLEKSGIAQLPSKSKTAILEQLSNDCRLAGLEIPKNDYHHEGGAYGKHTEYLGFILAEMQFLQRAYPDLNW